MPDVLSVTTWLRDIENLTDQARTTIQEDLEADGYGTPDQIDATAINGVADKKEESGRWKLAWRRLLLASLTKKKKPESKEPLKATIPAGVEMDLSVPKATMPDGVEFILPTSLGSAASSEELKMAELLTPEDWIVVAKTSQMLHGYRMDLPSPDVARLPVRFWKVPGAGERYFLARGETADISTEVTYHEQSSSYVRAGFNKETVSAGLPFAALSIERAHEERRAGAAASKKLHMVGRWYLPKATVYLDRCASLSRPLDTLLEEAKADTFLARIDAALALESSKPAEASRLLDLVFQDFGHMVPQNVVLGAELVFTHEKDVTSATEEKKVKEVWGTAVAGKSKKYGLAVNAGGVGGSGSADASAVADMIDKMRFEPKGGTPDESGNPAKWLPTTRNPLRWAVISATSFVPTVNLLDAERKGRVLALYKPSTVLGYASNSSLENYPETPREGFLLGCLQAVDDPSDGTLLAYASLSGSAEEVRLGGASVHRRSQRDRFVDWSSFFMPVPKGYTAVARHDKNDGNTSAYLRFLPIGTGGEEQYLKPATLINGGLSSDLTTTDHGFLLCTIDASQGARAHVLITDTKTSKVLARTSAHGWETRKGWSIRTRYQGFCVPVKPGLKLRIDVDITYGSPEIRIYSVPLLNRRCGDPVIRKIHTGYVAESDGFVVGQLEAPTEHRGSLQVTVSDKLDAVAQGDRLGVTSVHHYTEHDQWIRNGTFTAPVRKGLAYRAELTKGYGDSLAATVHWVPLIG